MYACGEAGDEKAALSDRTKRISKLKEAIAADEAFVLEHVEFTT